MEAIQDDLYQQASETYIGQWNKLVSTTNWEKGRIILQWRRDLIAQGAPVAEYADEVWSRRVGNVSPQHVGRLRRVSERFDEVRDEFSGLYWSHFQATLDWEDAEMWLEGAVQNRWSVAQMKQQRWEALGAPEDQNPADEAPAASELDEDVDPQLDGAPPQTITASTAEVQDADGQAAPWDETDRDAEAADGSDDEYADEDDAAAPSMPAAPKVRLFENLPNLPEDLSDAVESFKLAIIRHKLAGWQEASTDDVAAALDALKALALAPAEE